MKLYISAGHNVTKGKGNGAISAYGDEAVLAAEIRGRIVTAIPTAYIDSDSMKLSEVISDVNRRVGKNAFAAEIHFNSSANKSANGTLCVVANNASATSKRRGKEIATLIASTLGTTDKGAKTEQELGRSRLAFVRDTLCPAVIVEICFLSNKEDMEKFTQHKEELISKLIEYFKSI